MAEWGGRAAAKARAWVGVSLPAPCGRCGVTVHASQAWVVGHVKSRAAYPELTWQPSNWRPEHRGCSDASAQEAVIEKAWLAGAAATLSDQIAGFPGAGGLRTSPPLPVSLPALSPPLPEAPWQVRGDVVWSPEALEGHDWLRPFLIVPEAAQPPLAMSRPAPEAVGSYGADAVRWIEDSQRITLRWWQALAITRQLEHREDGSLCYREVLESAPRRAGKSVRVRGLALWRMAHPGLFGEVQTVVHTGSDVAICRDIQRGAWRWSEEVAGWVVSRANGKEAIETPSGDRWLVRSQGAVYGYDVTLGIVDEAWDVRPDTVSEGLEPATLERLSPQLHLTSTAHRRATSLMRARLSVALATEDPDTLLLLWGAPAGADPSDEAVWRAASPHWTEDRRRLIARKFAAAEAGRLDPEADDLDPMAGFTAQYLNVWRLNTAAERGDPVVAVEDWSELEVERPAGRPRAAAVESWYSAGVSLALAWRAGAGTVVQVTDHPDLVAAVAALKVSGFTGVATVGKSLMEDKVVQGVRKRPGQGRTAAAVQDLVRAMDGAALWHTGGGPLTEQVLAARTLPGPDGPRMASTARADAIKAAAWALVACQRRTTGRPRVIVAS